jgi:hypothetical protein
VPLNLSARRNVIVIGGMSGSGKSTFTLRYLINAPLACRFVFDVDGQFSQRLGITPATTPGELSAALFSGWVCFSPHLLFPGEPELAFKFFCEWAYEKSLVIEGVKAFAVDEVWNYCTPSAIPHELALVCKSGRTRELQLIVNAQEPQRINERITAEMSQCFLFRLTGEKSLVWARERGFEPAVLCELPDLAYVGRNCDTGGMVRGALSL